MYMYGSTITATQYPQYYKEGKHYTLPRPYDSSKSGRSGYRLMNCSWFCELVLTIQNAVQFFLEELHPDKAKSSHILDQLTKVKKIVPADLRISNSFFTHLTV